ncbi:hypothetical protein M2133_002330 [Parabacteroides sp. PF5-6]|nr:hypothetical protein [Parabacteroides sp. PF5-6]
MKQNECSEWPQADLQFLIQTMEKNPQISTDLKPTTVPFFKLPVLCVQTTNILLPNYR